MQRRAPQAKTTPINSTKMAHARRALTESLEQRVLLAGSTVTTLGAFANSGPFNPGGAVVRDSADAIYGVVNNVGSQTNVSGIFKLAKGASTPTLVATIPAAGGFSAGPGGLIIDGNDNIFGYTNIGGDTNLDGTFFELPKGATSITTLAQFDQATTGHGPVGNLVLSSNGDIFGTCDSGGPNGGGTVWRFNQGINLLTPVGSFQAGTGLLVLPGVNSLAIDGLGNFFGTTAGDPLAGVYGTIWEIPVGHSQIQTLALFQGTDGSIPTGPIVLDAAGDIFGATRYGGANTNGTLPAGLGTVYELVSGASSVTSLGSFDGTNGEYPVGGLVADSNGNLFGTASKGGTTSTASPAGAGTVFEVVKGSNTITRVVAFADTNGRLPEGGVTLDSAGNLYGTTSAGGSQSGGTVFEIGAGGSIGGGGVLTATATVKTPANIIAGQKISATINSALKNTSALTVTDSISFTAYLSTNGIVDNNSIALVTSGLKRLTIKAKKAATARATIRSVPSATPAGTYHYIVEYKNESGTAIDVQSTNTVTVAAPKLDISGSFAKFVSKATHGKPYSETLTVSNIGANVAAAGTLSIVVGYLPADANSPIGALPVVLKKKVTIKPNKSIRIPLSLKAPVAGNYSLFINLDASAILAAVDSNPENNKFTSPTTFTVS